MNRMLNRMTRMFSKKEESGGNILTRCKNPASWCEKFDDMTAHGHAKR